MSAQILVPDLDLVNKAKYILHIDDIVPGDPHKVAAAARRARKLATECNGARQVIDRVHGISWKGNAGRNFRTVQDQLRTTTTEPGSNATAEMISSPTRTTFSTRHVRSIQSVE